MYGFQIVCVVWKFKVVRNFFVKTTKEAGIQLLDNESRRMKRYEIYFL